MIDSKWPAIIILSAIAAAFVVYHDVEHPLRPVILLWFLLIGPGMAFVPLIRIHDHIHEVVVAAALSLSIDVIVAGAILYAGMWSPALILALLIAISLIGIFLQLWGNIRRRHQRKVNQPVGVEN